MPSRMAKLFPLALLALVGAAAFMDYGQAQKAGRNASVQIPKTWDEAALAEWATPVAGLNVRPTHISAKEYYALTVENLRTYPVYINGKEPEGYWEMLNRVGPQPLIEPEKLKTKAGQKVFAREGCAACHTPPLYTNNKLTLAEGFTPPKDAPATLDIMRLAVGTDPGLALGTRKGTGFYKVPSLKGVWYRGHYLHDGSVASLEEMFDPDRLKETHVPGGWIPPGVKTHAIKGHEFGLKLSSEERAQLIAFLRTL